MNGGTRQVGNDGVIAARRSCTNWRAPRRSVPRSKMSVMEDSWGTSSSG